MGRTRPKQKQKNTKLLSEHDSQPAPSIPALIEKTQSLITQCDYPLAHRFVQRILESEPANIVAQEMLGVIQLELGEIEEGQKTFLSIVSSANPPPPSAHLYLAQLAEDPNEALRYYQSAVNLLQAQLKQNASDQEPETTVVRALIGMVEIWLDPEYDLCFLPEAPDTCEKLLSTALEVSPGNPEALQSLASVRLSQERPEEAKECVEKAWLAWKNLDPDSPSFPPPSTMISLTKLLLELHLYSPALAVLQVLTTADDEDVEVWYLGGWACYLMMEAKRAVPDSETEAELGPNVEPTDDEDENWDSWTWKELGTEARERLERCQLLHEASSHPDKPLLEHTRELLGQLAVAGISSSVADEEQDDEAWADVDSSDEEDVEMS